MVGLTIRTDLTEKILEIIDSESWKAYLIAVLLIFIPLIIHMILT